MFRGKQSSNRIELSRLVQDLLKFGVLGSLRLWGWGGGWMGLGVFGGCPHTCAHTRARTHTHARACMRGKHDNFMQMAAPNGFGEILGIPYDVICVRTCVRMRACACVCTCAGGTLSPPPTPTHPPPHHHPPTPPPPRGGTPGISQNSIALELIEIFQFRLKI